MTIWLNLAGWRIQLVCASAGPAAQAAERYAGFVISPAAAADLTVEMRPAAGVLAAAEVAKPADSEPDLALLHAPIRLVGDTYLLDTSGIHGRIDLQRRQARLLHDGAASFGQLEYFLRIACALLAYQAGGLMVHAAGLQVGDAVYLFIGQSGSGKSTVVALSRDAAALSDDLVLLRPATDGWQAHGTPFWNLDASDADVRGGARDGPLAGIYKLVQDPAVYLEPLSLPVAVAELAANCPVVNGIAADLPGLLGRCRALAQAVPPTALHFRKDPGFWRLIR
ncbi:MAG: hypothetical protein BWY52_01982 [Chloroflexi bacterium ADurb.Bin325]|nr:MAG: hypothetical protein BWY52_01982 [Chloroflexi bacterium ADurb.Bin325]